MKLVNDRYRQQARRTGTVNGVLLILGGLLLFVIGASRDEIIGGLALGAFMAASGSLLIWWTRR